MQTPNKLIPVSESSVYKSIFLIKNIGQGITVLALYKASKSKFLDITDFIDALEILFVTEKIILDMNTGIITNA